MRLQITCLVALQPISKVFWLDAPSNHLCGWATAYFQGVLAKCAFKPPVWLRHILFHEVSAKGTLQTACFVALQPISKVFWLKAPSNHLFGWTTAYFQGVLAK